MDAAFVPAQKVNPGNPLPYYGMGQLFEKRGRRPEALKELGIALKPRPEFPSAKKDFERLSKA